MKIKLVIKTSMVVLLLTVISCTKLNENDYLFDTVNSDNFYQTDAELSSAVGAAYSNLAKMASNGTFIPSEEVTTDECVVPTRGPDWGDGGRWVRLQTHTYNSADPDPSLGHAASLCL